MNTSSRIRLVQLLPLLMVLMLLASACQPAAAPAPVQQPQPTAAPAAKAPAAATSAPAAAAKGGELRIIFRGSEPKLLDAHQDPFDQAAMFTVLTSDLLIFKDKDKKFQPWLATEWNVSPDFKTWTFKLRQDVKFHDGTPFNAEAVKFNFDRILDPKFESGQSRAMLGPIEKTEVVDPFTFRVVHKQPFPPFIDSIAEGFIAIWSPTAVQKYGIRRLPAQHDRQRPVQAGRVQAGRPLCVRQEPRLQVAAQDLQEPGPGLPGQDHPPLHQRGGHGAWPPSRPARPTWCMGFPPADLGPYENNPKYTAIKAARTGSPVLFVMNTSKAAAGRSEGAPGVQLRRPTAGARADSVQGHRPPDQGRDVPRQPLLLGGRGEGLSV